MQKEAIITDNKIQIRIKLKYYHFFTLSKRLMFKNLGPIAIKFKGIIEIIPKINNNNIKTQSTKNKPKYNKLKNTGYYIECDDEYVKKIIKNGGL
mgnify:CR=1 FL=1